MTEKSFEAWRDSYMSHKWKVPSLEEAWQASRQQALEEAIGICTRAADKYQNRGWDSGGPTHCASAIRSLTSPIGDKA